MPRKTIFTCRKFVWLLTRVFQLMKFMTNSAFHVCVFFVFIKMICRVTTKLALVTFVRFFTIMNLLVPDQIR